jgi:cytochrome c556
LDIDRPLRRVVECRGMTRAVPAFAACLFGLALVLGMIVLPPGAASAQTAARQLDGPWGPFAEEAPAPRIAGPAQGATFLRRNRMRAMSAHYRAIEAMAAFDPLPQPKIVAEADALRLLADTLPEHFTIRSPRTGDAGAKEAIWNEPELFAEHLAGIRSATTALHAAAQTGVRETLLSALDAARYQCLACHYHYRQIPGRPGAEGRRGQRP